jgi:hypothetical protein
MFSVRLEAILLYDKQDKMSVWVSEEIQGLHCELVLDRAVLYSQGVVVGDAGVMVVGVVVVVVGVVVVGFGDDGVASLVNSIS